MVGPSPPSDEGTTGQWLAGVFDRAAATYDVAAEGYHQHYGRRLVALAGISAGQRVLDVACGRGAALVPAARTVGPSGTAVGCDISPVMVELARRALRVEGLSGSAALMDAERLSVRAGTWDCVLCAFGLFFLPQPELALAEFRRALTSDGAIAVSTWGAEDPRWAWEDELLADVHVERRAVVRPLDTARELVDLLEVAGFTDVAITEEQHEVVLADADEWWAWKWSYSLRGLLEQLPAERVARLRQDAGPHLEALATAEGLPLQLTALVATGRVTLPAPTLPRRA